MKARLKKKQVRRIEYTTRRILSMYEFPVKKRRKAILRIHGINPWMINNVTIYVLPPNGGICYAQKGETK